MEKVNFEQLLEQSKRLATKVNFNDNQGRFRKVAFDVYQSVGGDESLWTLQEENGVQYLVAQYDDQVGESKQSGWNTSVDKKCANITLFYLDVPLKRFSSAQYQFDKENAHLFAKAIVNLANENKEFAKDALSLLKTAELEKIVRENKELLHLYS